jgi:hypothetical protein
MPPISEEALIRYCNTVYEALKAESKDGLWEGAIMRKFGTLGISNAHYGKVMNTLYELGSIEQVRRGARSNPTIIRLHRKPDAERVAGELGLTSRLTNASPYDMLLTRLNTLERRFEGIDVAQYIHSTETRLRALEAEWRKFKESNASQS